MSNTKVTDPDNLYAIIKNDNRFKNSYNVILFGHDTINTLNKLYQGKRGLTTRKIVKEIKQLFPEVDQKLDSSYSCRHS